MTINKDFIDKFINITSKAALDKENVDTFGGWKEDKDTGQQYLSQEMFIYPLINAVKELSAKVEELESKLNGE